MKNLFYCVVLILVLSACGEKADIKEKAFLDQSIQQFIEYDKIAQSMPKVSLSSILAKMSELKLSVSNHKLSKDCKDSADYLVKNIEIIQDKYYKFVRDETSTSDRLYFDEAMEQIQQILASGSCANVVKIANKKQQEDSFLISLHILDIQKTKKYIDRGIDVNVKDIYGTTALMLASNSESQQIFDAVKLLIDNGADVNAKNINGSTALMFAVNNKNPEVVNVVKLLIDNGADINAADLFGSTVLMLAVASENPKSLDIIKLLVDNGAGVNAKNVINDETALIATIESKNKNILDVVKFLINEGADVNVKSFEDCSLILLSQTSLSFWQLEFNLNKELFEKIKDQIDLSKRLKKQASILKIATNSEHPQKNDIIKLLKQHGAK